MQKINPHDELFLLVMGAVALCWVGLLTTVYYYVMGWL